MSEVYSLRRGRSPYRNKPPTTTPTNRRSRKSLSNDQEEQDSIHVATYNDSPKHLYGLDKNPDEEPPKESILKFNPFPWKKNDQRDTSKQQSSLKDWFWMTLYIISVVCLFEGITNIYTKKYKQRTSETPVNDTDAHVLKRLLEQINVQKDYLDKVSEDIQVFHHSKTNCLCNKTNEKPDQIGIEKLQKQILSTIEVVKVMNEKVSKVQKELDQQAEKELEEQKSREKEICVGEDCLSSSTNIYSTMQSLLDNYQADVLGLPDFALESAGGSVYSNYHSETCDVGAPIIKVFGLSLWQDPRSPRSIIQRDTSPGNCWPMKSYQGYIVLKLAVPIEVTMFTLEHLDKKLDKYSNEMYQLAPREFEVYAWKDKDGHERVKLGQYAYLRENNAIQTFKSQVKLNKPVSLIELRILSNYGNPDCTCLYRFRVHGLSYQWDDLDMEL